MSPLKSAHRLQKLNGDTKKKKYHFPNEWAKLKEKQSECNSVLIGKNPKAEFNQDLRSLIFKNNFYAVIFKMILDFP